MHSGPTALNATDRSGVDCQPSIALFANLRHPLGLDRETASGSALLFGASRPSLETDLVASLATSWPTSQRAAEVRAPGRGFTCGGPTSRCHPARSRAQPSGVHRSCARVPRGAQSCAAGAQPRVVRARITKRTSDLSTKHVITVVLISASSTSRFCSAAEEQLTHPASPECDKGGFRWVRCARRPVGRQSPRGIAACLTGEIVPVLHPPCFSPTDGLGRFVSRQSSGTVVVRCPCRTTPAARLLPLRHDVLSLPPLAGVSVRRGKSPRSATPAISASLRSASFPRTPAAPDGRGLAVTCIATCMFRGSSSLATSRQSSVMADTAAEAHAAC